ncbi:HigA family addiction module antidote protein [Candidatus Acetothermia bacterium]|nr:HigA family addiction module antidote protein [Candidatus Acetothermia bacterium]
MKKSSKRRQPVHPGEILREEFLNPLDLTPYALAKAIGVPAPRVNDIVLERRSISTDTARRLAAYFGTSAELWMSLQDDYELEVERDKMSDADLLQSVRAKR